jgi:hypothetical protein
MGERAIDTLVRELLLDRTAGLGAAELAAFIDGWSSLLDLVRRTHLTLPGADADVAAAIAELVEHIRAAQARVLDDGTG